VFFEGHRKLVVEESIDELQPETNRTLISHDAKLRPIRGSLPK
jgi:hypothetical protein